MLVRVKERYQITVPTALRKKLHVAVGDVLDAEVSNGCLKLRAQSLVDRELATALKELKAGRYEEFDNVEDMIASLHAAVKKKNRRKK